MPRKSTAPARGLSPSARARGATCQLRPPTPSQRRVSRSAGAPALAVSGEEAQHSSLLARAPCRAGCGRLMPKKGAAPARGLSPSARGRGATCQLRPPTPSQRRVSRSAGAPALAVSGEEAQHSSLLARAPCRAGCGRPMPRKSTAPARGLSPSARGRGATCQLRPPTPSQRRVSRAQARLRSLSLGRRRSTRACSRARRAALVVVGYALGRALRRREASLLRRAAVVRRASCGLQRQASAACHARARTALAVSGRRRSTRACYARAPCRAGCGRLMPRKSTASARGLSPSARARGATCQLRPPTPSSAACHAAQARTALAVSGRRRSTRACCCARRAALVVVGHAYRRAPRRREASLLRRAPVVRRASCGLQRQASAACHARARHLRSLSLRRRRSTQACSRARRAALVVVGPCTRKGHCAGERPLFFGARPWCDVPAAASNAKPAPRVTRRARACARCLLGGGAALELATRARRAALVVVGSCL